MTAVNPAAMAMVEGVQLVPRWSAKASLLGSDAGELAGAGSPATAQSSLRR